MNTIKRYYKVISLPLFEDNYCYVVQGTAQNRLVLVDPANPPVVLSFLKTNFPQHLVSHVLYTHKHWDHAGGSLELYKELSQTNPQVSVVIGEHDRNFVEGATYSLAADEKIQIGGSIVQTLHVPCHTKGHTIYNFLPLHNQQHEQSSQLVESRVEGRTVRLFQSESCAFTGDTLFIGGIGRFFEGNAGEMVGNIKKMYSQINELSHIYCGHEYTLANLSWAATVEKSNEDISKMLALLEGDALEKRQICTIPSTLAQERLINLFVRTVTGTPLLSLANNDSVELMKALREMKNKNSNQFPVTSSL